MKRSNHRICLVLRGPTLQEAHQEVESSLQMVDLFELRLDLFSTWTLKSVQHLLESFDKPFILTLRGKQQGGGYLESEKSRQDTLLSLAALKPTYLDLEYNLPSEFIERVLQVSPSSRIIGSYHDFNGVPSSLDIILSDLQKLPVHEIKIACAAKTCLDSFKILTLLKNYQGTKPLTAFCMGEEGEFSRVLAAKYGSSICYSFKSSGQQTAQGQIDLNTLTNLYNLLLINAETSVFALIGDPVAQSKGIFVHNAMFKKLGYNAVYVRIRVVNGELGQSLAYIKELSFKGLSVTMPLKESVVRFLTEKDELVQRCGSANTLLLKDGKLKGFNTDGIGARTLLERKLVLNNKKISLFGAGGTARAIAFACVLKGAKITIFNRTLERASAIAKALNLVEKGCSSADTLENYKAGHEQIIIQCTSKGMNDPEVSILPSKQMPKNILAFDVVSYPTQTKFLKEAKESGCDTLSGRDLFIEQALEQYRIWFEGSLDRVHLHKLFNELRP